MKRFINDNVVLVPGIRTAPRITQDELRDIIIKAAINVNEDFFNSEVEMLDCAGNLNEELEIAASIIVQEDEEIESDNQYQFGWSLFNTKRYAPDSMCGLHTLSNGFTFFGFTTAEDDQWPAFGILYYDGTRLRLYFPTYGNDINLDFGCALGWEGDGGGPKETHFEAEYRKLGIWDEDDDRLFEYGEPNWAELYYAKYQVAEPHENWSQMMQDIEVSIKVI